MSEPPPDATSADRSLPTATPPASPPPSVDAPSERQAALLLVVRELEQHVAAQGWDGPVRLFALVRTAAALARDPELAAQLPAEVLQAAQHDPEHLTAVEQEDLPTVDTIEELLGQIQWPATVDGVAVSMERIVLPPDAAQDLPDEESRAREAAAAHPARRDMRLVAAALRSGETGAAIRLRELDQDALVSVGPDLLPEVCAALAENLSA